MSSNEMRDEGKINFKIFGMVLPLLPGLMLRLSGTFLKFKREAKKGGKVFHKELINQGLDKEKANQLTEMYLESSQLANYFKNLR